DLRSRNNRGILVQEEIAKKFGAAFNPMMVVCRADDLETLMQRNRDANRRLDAFVGNGTLLGYESIFSYLPARADQEAVIHALKDGRVGSFTLARIEWTFREALRQNA